MTLPLISIVTPSYNQGEFLEKTIQSVLTQDYPNLEYMIIDGGSTDQSVEIIHRYKNHLAYWISEKDRGQTHAINKGLKRCRGEIWAYLNSDDIYPRNTLRRVAEAFQDSNVSWVTGRGLYVDVDGQPVGEMVPQKFNEIGDVLESLFGESCIVSVQVSNFMRRSILNQYGFFDENLHYCMDVDFTLRLLLNGVRPYIINEVLGEARLHNQSKTVMQNSGGAFDEEKARILNGLLPSLSPQVRKRVRFSLRSYAQRIAVSDAFTARERAGVWAGIRHLAGSALSDPRLLGNRMAWGAIRRILFSRPGRSISIAK